MGKTSMKRFAVLAVVICAVLVASIGYGSKAAETATTTKSKAVVHPKVANGNERWQ